MDSFNRRDVLKASAATCLVGLPKVESTKSDVVLPKKQDLKTILLKNQEKFNLTQDITPYQNELSIKAVSSFVDNLISNQLFGVQPLVEIEGKIYYIRVQHEASEAILIVTPLKTKCVKEDYKACLWPNSVIKSFSKEFEKDSFDDCAEAIGVTLATEVDRKNIQQVLKNAAIDCIWDFNLATGETIKEKSESLYSKIFDISNNVHRKILHGSANWILTSPHISAIFEMANVGFEPNNDDSFMKLGPRFVGTINNRWKLFKDPLFPKDQILLGYKGSSSLASGYVYSPHVMFSDFSKEQITSESCGQFVPNGENFYAKIKVLNFR